MLFLLEIRVGYGADMTQTDLFSVWTDEAKAALWGKSEGTVVDLWKCVGERRVIAVLDVESPDALDQIIFTLPLVREMGQHVDIKVTPLRRYEDFAADVVRWRDEASS